MAKKMDGVELYKSNPFTEVLEIRTKKKMIKVGHGKQLIDTRTGEMENVTQIITYKEVDDDEFVKFFTGNIALTFDLTAAGNKAFQLVMRVAQKEAIGRDDIYLNDEVVESFVSEFKVKLSISTFRRGLKEILLKQILAKSTKTNVYYINPNLIFNGDRVAFTQAVKRKKKSEFENESQRELMFGSKL
jgi:hypothetical protein